MPTRARSRGRSVLGSLTEMPSTVIVPCANGSRPFTHLISVDLPEPDGPQTTTTSPLATWVLQSSSTWAWPYHFERLRISIMIPVANFLANSGDTFLQLLHGQRQAEADGEVDQGREHDHFHRPIVVLAHDIGRLEHVLGADRIHQRGVLKQHDGLRQQYRDHVPHGLRQYHMDHGLRLTEAQRPGRIDLAARHALDAGAHDLAIEGRLEGGE